MWLGNIEDSTSRLTKLTEINPDATVDIFQILTDAEEGEKHLVGYKGYTGCIAIPTTSVPGLAYTLDFLHFQYQGIPQSESEKLIKLAGHMHVRQAQKDFGKCDFLEGEIDYASIAAKLKAASWSGDITTEFWCSEEMKRKGVDPIEENIVMRYWLKHLLKTTPELVQ